MIKRYSGSSAVDVTTRKRFTGSGWVDLTFGKRWSGSAWVDLWNDSGGSGGNNSISTNVPQNSSGVLFSDMKSTVSSPTVHYSASLPSARPPCIIPLHMKFLILPSS